MPVTTLFGKHCGDLGSIRTHHLGSSLAIGNSPGRFPKAMAVLDPNEEAVAAMTVGDRGLLAVADGHNGSELSHAAIRAISSAGESLLGQGGVWEAFEVARAACEETDTRSPGCGTTLTVVAIEDGIASAGTVGDSRAVVIARRTRFLDSPSPFWSAGQWAMPRVRSRKIGDSPVVVATDGLFDFLGRDPLGRVTALVHTDALSSVTRLIEAAHEGAAGDHISVGVFGRCYVSAGSSNTRDQQ